MADGSNGCEILVEEYKFLRERFGRNENDKIISDCLRKTLAWLDAAEESYSSGGSTIQEPWWTKPEPTENPVLREERAMQLRYRAFQHGLINFLRNILRSGLYDHISGRADKEIVSVATDIMSLVVVGELIKGKTAGPPHDTVSLAFLKRLYRYGEGTKLSTARKSRIHPMAELGFITVQFDGSNYALSIGPVAERFYMDIYLPMLEKHGKDL